MAMEMRRTAMVRDLAVENALAVFLLFISCGLRSLENWRRWIRIFRFQGSRRAIDVGVVDESARKAVCMMAW
jgi:hypothetical protein